MIGGQQLPRLRRVFQDELFHAVPVLKDEGAQKLLHMVFAYAGRKTVGRTVGIKPFQQFGRQMIRNLGEGDERMPLVTEKFIKQVFLQSSRLLGLKFSPFRDLDPGESVMTTADHLRVEQQFRILLQFSQDGIDLPPDLTLLPNVIHAGAQQHGGLHRQGDRIQDDRPGGRTITIAHPEVRLRHRRETPGQQEARGQGEPGEAGHEPIKSLHPSGVNDGGKR